MVLDKIFFVFFINVFLDSTTHTVPVDFYNFGQNYKTYQILAIEMKDSVKHCLSFNRAPNKTLLDNNSLLVQILLIMMLYDFFIDKIWQNCFVNVKFNLMLMQTIK